MIGALLMQALDVAITIICGVPVALAAIGIVAYAACAMSGEEGGRK